jgi:hypothetical protein
MEYVKLRSHEFSYWYNPENVKRTYGIVLQTTKNQKKIQIHYKFEVLFLKQDFDNYFYFKGNKQQVYVDEKQPDLLFDEIADACGKVLYPLEIKVSPYGGIVNITNHKEIKERWKDQKGKISKSYKGKEIEALLQKMDMMVADFYTIKNTIQHEWFLKLFFSPIHNSYGSPKEKTEIALKLIPYQPAIPYEVEQFVTYTPGGTKGLLYHQIGTCCDIRTEEDIWKGNLFSVQPVEQKAKGKVHITYEIYKNSPVFDRILGNCWLQLPSGYTQETTIEIYNLKNEQPKTDLEEQIEAIAEKKKEPKPKKRFSFW